MIKANTEITHAVILIQLQFFGIRLKAYHMAPETSGRTIIVGIGKKIKIESYISSKNQKYTNLMINAKIAKINAKYFFIFPH